MKNKLLILGAGLGLLLCGYWIGSQGSGLTASKAVDKTAKFISTGATYQKPTAPVAYTKPAKQNFLRVKRDSEGKALTVDTTITSYVPRTGADLQVDLIGAVHVGDLEYFQKLNDSFKVYDAVLYELVAPPNTRPVPGMLKAEDPFSMFQQMLPKFLGLSHQLDQVDYQATNFVHADLSFADLAAEAKRRGDTAFTIAAGMLIDFIKVIQRTQDPENPIVKNNVSLMELISSPTAFKSSFVDALELMDDSAAIGGFTTLTPYIIEARNNEALAVLDQVIESGKRKVAIFYGAAHLPDFELKLLRDYGLKRFDNKWVMAWDLSKPAPETSPLEQLQVLLKLLQN